MYAIRSYYVIMAIDYVLERGATDVTCVCLLAAPEGIENVKKAVGDRADVSVVVACVDEKLNEVGYIVPRITSYNVCYTKLLRGGLDSCINLFQVGFQDSHCPLYHLVLRHEEIIPSRITSYNVCYTKLLRTATLPEQYTNKFAQQSRYSSGCSSGGCGVSGGAGAGPTAWKAAPATGTINRTTLQVSNLSCTSCLANIAAELGKLADTYGMNGFV